MELVEELCLLTCRYWVWAFTLAGSGVELLVSKAFLTTQTLTLAGVGVKALVAKTMNHPWTLALTCPAIKHL